MSVCLATLSSCGGTSRPVILNTEKVERSVERSIRAQRHLVATVSCPDNVEQRRGNNFTCFATIGSRRYPVTVSQVDGNGHVQYVVR
jgi:hypothetical protein